MAKNKKLTPRRMAREWAMQFLFQNDVRNSDLEDEDLQLFWDQLRNSPSSPKKERDFEQASTFAEELIRGVFANRSEIDEFLKKSPNLIC